MITQEYLKYLLHYDQETGCFIWVNPSKFHSEKKNKSAGTIRDHRGKKYLKIKIDSKHYRAHALAWLYVYGYMPIMMDHINGDSLDNSIVNLRETNYFQNTQNHTRRINKSGLPVGVRTLQGGKFLARITANHKIYSLGTYQTPKEASKAYSKMRLKLHSCEAAKQRGILC